jgi:hypothetical protein
VGGKFKVCPSKGGVPAPQNLKGEGWAFWKKYWKFDDGLLYPPSYFISTLIIKSIKLTHTHTYP